MYRVKGADQKIYGPVDAEQVIAWIQDNRLNRYSTAQKEGESSWKPLDQFPEFVAALGAGPRPTPPPPFPTVEGGTSTSAIPSNPASPTDPNPAYSTGAPVYAPVSDPERAARLVKAPAIVMILVSLAGIVITLVSLAAFPKILDYTLEMAATLPTPLPAEQLSYLKEAKARGVGVGDYIRAGVSLLAYGLVMVGAVSMLRLERWGLALTAGILVMLPCTCCCCLGIPAGIWAAIVLNRPDVRGAFR